jgi:hypothetical protein
MSDPGRGYLAGMNFVVADDNQDDLGARIEDVAQEAIDATAALYANDPGVDGEEQLRAQLSGRGVAAADEATLDEVARSIRAGHSVSVGQSDGSVDGRSH